MIQLKYYLVIETNKNESEILIFKQIRQKIISISSNAIITVINSSTKKFDKLRHQKKKELLIVVEVDFESERDPKQREINKIFDKFCSEKKIRSIFSKMHQENANPREINQHEFRNEKFEFPRPKLPKELKITQIFGKNFMNNALNFNHSPNNLCWRKIKNGFLP